MAFTIRKPINISIAKCLDTFIIVVSFGSINQCFPINFYETKKFLKIPEKICFAHF